MTGTTAGMLESVRVQRRCWRGPKSAGAAAGPYVRFEVSWITPAGRHYGDEKMFRFTDLMELPDGVVPMLTGIISDDRIEAHVYLIRVTDDEGLPDVVARMIPQHTHDPDGPFILDGVLDESGPNIYPLPIYDWEPEPDLGELYGSQLDDVIRAVQDAEDEPE